MPGPPPKRDANRRRRNDPAGGPATTAAGGERVTPEWNPDWHPVAARWFGSLAASGQSVFYESSDWATAYVIAESMSLEFLSGEPPKAASLAAWLKGMSSLMVTEGDRRRVRLELERPQSEGGDGEASVSELDAYRERIARESS